MIEGVVAGVRRGVVAGVVEVGFGSGGALARGARLMGANAIFGAKKEDSAGRNGAGAEVFGKLGPGSFVSAVWSLYRVISSSTCCCLRIFPVASMPRNKG